MRSLPFLNTIGLHMSNIWSVGEKAVARVAKKFEKELGAGKQAQGGRGGQEGRILQGTSISKASC